MGRHLRRSSSWTSSLTATFVALRNVLRLPALMLPYCVAQVGFDIKRGEHPIVPIMLFDSQLAGEMAQKLLAKGIYVVGFSYPVVPKARPIHH